ncbi:MAG: dihydrofolate reductase family protein [Anaerolineales bacterium]|nr:dihydrofolate reductase family protein [Anaerolineales bacterium]
MSKVIVELSMSLDGFIARPDNSTDEVHAWYFNGNTEVAMPNSELVFKTDPVSAELIREQFRTIGANVTGRRTFDDAQAWGGRDPYGVPSFIVSHTIPMEWSGPDSPFTFVTEGVASAIAQAKAAAGNKDVAVAAASIAQQCLNLGLLDEIQIHLAPVLLGEGIRLFDHLSIAPMQLERTRVIEAPHVTHLYFRVVK